MSRKAQKLLYGFLLVLFAAVFVYSAYRLIAYYSAKHESDRVVAEAQRYVSHPEGTGLDKEEEKERLVVELRYGLGGKPPKRQREVADITGISRSYVSRIEKKALQKLRSALDR